MTSTQLHSLSRRPAARSGEDAATAIRSAHLVGICGAGMKALAELLVDSGIDVTGSDLQRPTPAIRAMQRRGLRVHFGHQDDFVPARTDVVVYSPAVGPANPERREAARLGIPQLSYSEMLGRLMQDKTGVAIAGTHGKSTTTALAATLLQAAGVEPSAVIGAELVDSGRSGWAGNGDAFVVESCEYQRSFLDLSPTRAGILGIEPDHFDYFHDFDDLLDAFRQFARNVHPSGRLVVNGECAAAVACARATSAEVVTFGRKPGLDWWVADVRPASCGTRFRLFHRERFHAEYVLGLAGEHNVLNAAAAIAVCDGLGIDRESVRNALADFRGIKRRFECVGSWRGVTLIDDYAHHPTAVRATLRTARARFGCRKLWCAFQPHQVSRTRELMAEFADSFEEADEVLIAPVYAARETCGNEPFEVAGELAERIETNGVRSHVCGGLDRLIEVVDDAASPGDVLITMGAGDIDRVHHEFTRRLHRHHAAR